MTEPGQGCQDERKRRSAKPAEQEIFGQEFLHGHDDTDLPAREAEPLIPAHLANQVRLEKEGIMFAAGPLSKEDGSRYGGMFVLRANSFEEARAIADADPLHKAGLRSYTLMRWTVNEGSYAVRINYSDQSVTID